MDIKDATISQLLEWFEDEIRWAHYDPHGGMDRAPFNRYELRDEIKQRVEKIDYSGNRCSSEDE